MKKAKKKAKKVVKKKKAVKKEKPAGLMMTFYELIQKHQPISAESIFARLKKQFPDHNPESMKRCIPRYPKCLADSKGIKDIGTDEQGRYIIIKKAG